MKTNFIKLLFMLLLSTFIGSYLVQAQKPKVIVTTDMGADPDDQQSMVRFLVQSNEYDVKGLIVSTSCWRTGQNTANMDKYMKPLLTAYESAYNNLKVHSADFPTPTYLRSVTKLGNIAYGYAGIGSGKDSDGSRLIIAAVDATTVGNPIIVQSWGGSNTLAQALWYVKNTRTQTQVNEFVSKVICYDILGQDDTGAWMVVTFPNLIYIRAVDVYKWQRDKSDTWWKTNIQSHGALGSVYPNGIYVMEGDTPAFLHTVGKGLNDPADPKQRGWGGQFVSKKANIAGMSKVAELSDEKRWGTYYMYGNSLGPQEFKQAIENDFQARMDWAINSNYSSANHYPVVALNGDKTRNILKVNVAAGQTVQLSAAGTTDPDGHAMTYQWYYYQTDGNYGSAISISNSTSQTASVTVPSGATNNQMHFVVAVTDKGSPALTSYRRVILVTGGTPQVLPVVSISSPANNATFTAPATISIASNATISSGTISKVEFFNGSTKLGEDATSPYTYSWANVAAGTYTITANATSNTGQSTTSASVVVSVVNQTIAVSSITLAPTAVSLNVGASTQLTATVLPTNATNKSITWSSSNTSVATISSTGLVSGLAAGTATITVKTVDGSKTATASITVNAIPQTPYLGTQWPIPGKIEFEHFDVGGNGTAYLDNTPGTAVSPAVNFRTNEDVDIENCTDTGGGYNIGFFTAGEWLEYTVNVATAGEFEMILRVANNGNAKTISVSYENGTAILSNISIPNTGGWQTWQDVVVNANLAAGKQVLRFTMGATDYINLNNVIFKSKKIDADGDGVFADVDCDDTNPNIGAAKTWYADADGDGLGDAAATKVSCSQPAGYVAASGDLCVSDANKTTPGNCGCGIPEGTCGSTTFWLEAECGVVGSLFNKVSDANASGNSYVTVKSGNNSTANAPGVTGQISYTFTVGSAGSYSLWARVITPNGNDDSFWIQVDGGTWFMWNNIGPHTAWAWAKATTYSLPAGSHTLTIAYREDGALLDKLYITKDTDTPTGSGLSASNCVDNDVDKDGITVDIDCDDTNPNIGAPKTWYADADGDGFGDATITKVSCTQPTGYVAASGDLCPNDANKTIAGACGCGVPEGTCNTENIKVRAKGVGGGELLVLEINGTALKTWTMTTSYQVFTFTGAKTGVFKLNYTNDATGKDIQVDYLEVSGTVYQAENQVINTAAYANGACGGGSKTEMMHCNGYIQFNVGVACADTDGDGTDDCTDNCPNDPNKINPGECGCGVAENSCGTLQFAIPGGSNGLAACKAKYVGNIIPGSIRSDYSKYWNQVSPENAGKWGSVESSRNNYNWAALDAMYNYCQQNGMPFKQHVMIWGSQQPSWLSSLSAADQRKEVEEWYSLFAQRYPKTAIIDVVNESLPGHAPTVAAKEAMGGANNGASIPYLAANPQYGPYGTGWDYIIYAFAKARQYFPNAILVLNDYNIINSTSNINAHLQIVNILKARGLIDAVGIQAHNFSVDNMTAAQIKTNLNLLASAGLPIHVTELDITGSTEQQQRDRYAIIFPAFYEHPAVAGITLWGYVEGQTWKAGTGILNSNGTERLAMVWLKQYMASRPNVCNNLKSLESATGIDDQIDMQMLVYPNPVKNILNIEFNTILKESVTIKLVNSVGQTVFSEVVSSSNYSIDVTELPNGTYYMTVSGSNILFKHTIVK